MMENKLIINPNDLDYGSFSEVFKRTFQKLLTKNIKENIENVCHSVTCSMFLEDRYRAEFQVLIKEEILDRFKGQFVNEQALLNENENLKRQVDKIKSSFLRIENCLPELNISSSAATVGMFTSEMDKIHNILKI